jgi:hypothetical protein
MGQRHQIFVKSYTTERDLESFTAAFHHQWLYGGTAIQQLRNMLEFNKNVGIHGQLNGKYTQLSSNENMLTPNDIIKIVDNCFSMNVAVGYHSTMMSLNEEAAKYDENSLRPDYQDNNDGQTFVDFTGDKIKYCFTFPFDKEEDEEDETLAAKCWEPLSARDYVKHYYEINEFSDVNIDTLNETEKNDKAFLDNIKANIEWIEENVELMTQEEFFDLYPMLKP